MNNVTLCPMTREMCHTFYKGFKNDPAIGHYYEYVYTPEIADRYFENNSVPEKKLFAILVDGEIIGECKLKKIDPDKRECSMGIHLRDDSVKEKGYGTQAERLILQYAFEEMGMDAVNAKAVLKNTRSQHVLEKVGFQYTHEDDTFKYYRCEANRTARNIKLEQLGLWNVSQYIAYLHKALSDEPDMLWVDKMDEDAILKRLDDPFYQNTKSILAMDGENVVGRIEYHFYGCLQDGYRMAYVDWVYVLPAYRHSGIAQQLFKEFERDCAANRINQYYLIRATNPGADKFYHSFENAELDDEPVLRKTIIQ